MALCACSLCSNVELGSAQYSIIDIDCQWPLPRTRFSLLLASKKGSFFETQSSVMFFVYNVQECPGLQFQRSRCVERMLRLQWHPKSHDSERSRRAEMLEQVARGKSRAERERSEGFSLQAITDLDILRRSSCRSSWARQTFHPSWPSTPRYTQTAPHSPSRLLEWSRPTHFTTLPVPPYFQASPTKPPLSLLQSSHIGSLRSFSISLICPSGSGSRNTGCTRVRR